MKIFNVPIILILSVGCSKEKQITEFESILGKGNSENLTSMVSDFENDFLKRKYPNLSSEKAYKKLLIEMQNSEALSWNKLPKFDKTRFKQSQLKFEIYSYVDSV